MLRDPNEFQAATTLAKPSCRVYHSIDQDIATASLTNLSFDSERFDRWGMHSGGGSSIVIPVDGIYHVGATLHFAINTTGLRVAQFLVNSATRIASQSHEATGTLTDRLAISTLYSFGEGDTIEVEVYQDSTATIAVEADSAFSPEFYVAYHSRP